MLIASVISADAFALYGEVVLSGPVIRHNEGRGSRRDFPAALRHDAAADALSVSTTDIVPSPFPVTVSLIERHTLSSQMFVPRMPARLLVVVAPSDGAGEPLLDHLRAFDVPAGSAIHYFPGTWHAPLVALDGAAHLTMLMWVVGGPIDCEERALPIPVQVGIAPLE